MQVNIESKRQEAQQKVDSFKTLEERNVLGQYATPPKLAAEILSFAKKLLSINLKIRFLDPAFGTGAFYSALVENFDSKKIVEAKGFEIDKLIFQEAKDIWKNDNLHLCNLDFTKAEIPTQEQQKANLIICNPPYIRHHHLSFEDKIRLQSLSKTIAGANFNGLTGFYCYFLAICHAWLAQNGVACWLIPGEFMDVNYGQEVKKYLLNKVTLIRIHRYDPKDVQFDDALVSSSIIWFTKKTPTPNHGIQFTYGGTLENPKESRIVQSTAITPMDKWSNLPFSNYSHKSSSNKIKLSELFKIKRGLATGANDFFILSSKQIGENNLPAEFLIPILPSSRFLHSDIVESDENANPQISQKLYLLNCSLPEIIIKDKYPFLWKYLQKGIERGINERYLCKSRKLWYSQENRPAAPIVCTYMGRADKKRNKPFRFILNHSKATAANGYLMLYPNSKLTMEIAKNTNAIQSIWKQLNEISCNEVIYEGRVYGGGLHKIEPNELSNVLIESSKLDFPFWKI